MNVLLIEIMNKGKIKGNKKDEVLSVVEEFDN